MSARVCACDKCYILCFTLTLQIRTYVSMPASFAAWYFITQSSLIKIYKVQKFTNQRFPRQMLSFVDFANIIFSVIVLNSFTKSEIIRLPNPIRNQVAVLLFVNIFHPINKMFELNFKFYLTRMQCSTQDSSTAVARRIEGAQQLLL